MTQSAATVADGLAAAFDLSLTKRSTPTAYPAGFSIGIITSATARVRTARTSSGKP